SYGDWSSDVCSSDLPGRVGLIAFWQDEVALKQFAATHPLAAKLGGGLVVYARPLRIHGAWPGIGDDVSTHRTVEHEGPVLVLTRSEERRVGKECRTG